LRLAHSFHRIGRFQLEAAIQSAHCARRDGEPTDNQALKILYEALVAVAPTLGARVSLAAIIGETDGPDAALAALNAIDAPRFQPLWATRAHLLKLSGRTEDAHAALAKAISLTTDSATRARLIASAGGQNDSPKRAS
jgi:predicted RNA polymerase sigma factor